MKTSVKIAMGSVIAILLAVSVNAENSKKGKGERSGELKAYHQKMHEARKEFRKEAEEENKAFHETLKGKEPAEALTAIIAQRKKQYSERKTFFQGMHSELVAYVKETVPAEKQAEVLKKIEERREEGVAKHQEIHENLINALEGLKGNEDLTMKQIKETVSKVLPKRGKGRRNRKNNK